jgi:hypothetical protein
MTDVSPEARKLAQARKDAVLELKAIDGKDRKTNDPAVIRLGNARLYEASITLKVVNGETIAAAEFKAATDMVEAARGVIKEPLSIDIHVVGPADEAKCPECGHVFKPPEVRQTLEEAQHAASERIAKESAARAANAVVPQPAETPRSLTDVVPGAGKISTGRTPPPNVVELKRPSIHDPVVFGDGTKLNPPLKRPEAWQGYPLPTV